MPSQWDHKADKDLLLAIIEEGSLKSIVWPQIAEKMKAKEYTFTHEACRQHFQKIRKEAKSGGGQRSTPNSPSVKTTPRKISKTPNTSFSASKSANTSFSNAGNSSFNNNYDDEDDDENFSHTPTKRKRTLKKEEGQENGYHQSASLFKVEEMSGRHEAIDLENDDMYEG